MPIDDIVVIVVCEDRRALKRANYDRYSDNFQEIFDNPGFKVYESSIRTINFEADDAIPRYYFNNNGCWRKPIW